MKKKSAHVVAAIACIAIAGTGLAGCSSGLSDGASEAKRSSSSKPSSVSSPKSSTASKTKPSSTSSPKSSSASTAKQTSAASTSKSSSAPASSKSSAATASGKGTALNQVIDDSALKAKITVIEYVRGLPAQDPAMAERGDELVLVHVSIDQSSIEYPYYTTESGQFQISAPTSIGQSASSDLVKKYMSANGYPELKSVKGQSSGDGWVALYIKKGAPEVTFTYKRSGFQTTSGELPKFEGTALLK